MFAPIFLSIVSLMRDWPSFLLLKITLGNWINLASHGGMIPCIRGDTLLSQISLARLAPMVLEPLSQFLFLVLKSSFPEYPRVN